MNGRSAAWPPLGHPAPGWPAMDHGWSLHGLANANAPPPGAHLKATSWATPDASWRAPLSRRSKCAAERVPEGVPGGAPDGVPDGAQDGVRHWHFAHQHGHDSAPIRRPQRRRDLGQRPIGCGLPPSIRHGWRSAPGWRAMRRQTLHQISRQTRHPEGPPGRGPGGGLRRCSDVQMANALAGFAPPAPRGGPWWLALAHHGGEGGESSPVHRPENVTRITD
jgi:hypothetical protein